MSSSNEWRASGTIRLRIDNRGDKKIFLIPDPDHLAKDGDLSFVVFLPVNGGEGRALKLDSKFGDKGAELRFTSGTFSHFFRTALAVATKGTKVSVVIDDKKEVLSITVPSP